MLAAMSGISTAADGAPTPSLSEADLTARLRRGEDAAFEELVRRFGPQLLTVLRRYLPEEHDSQDALQETFLSVFKSIDRFQGESSLGTWLHRIAVNSALMKLR